VRAETVPALRAHAFLGSMRSAVWCSMVWCGIANERGATVRVSSIRQNGHG